MNGGYSNKNQALLKNVASLANIDHHPVKELMYSRRKDEII